MTANIEKELSYKKYTLKDTYTISKEEREFQWDKISKKIDDLVIFQNNNNSFGILKNYKNYNKQPPLAKNSAKDKYGIVRDSYGTLQSQGVPLYKENNLEIPERYARDGVLVSIIETNSYFVKVKTIEIEGNWVVPIRYVKVIKTLEFNKIIVIDRKNQNICTLDNVNNIWKVRSMNPITTGLEKPPYKFATPLGTYVIQGKLLEMPYLKDSEKEEIDGSAPFASRFSAGAYLHGIPVNLPSTEHIEYLWSLGTKPSSHMCVRNATSHAKFIYDWSIVNKTIVFVIE
ncbi:MAG: L,D-transpeptidase family protein [Fusobacteriaceae bacterium]